MHVKQPLWLAQEGHEYKMYKLYKVRPLWIEINSLCMKTCIDNYFKNIGFHKCPYNHALCIKQSKHGDVLFDSLYASDSIFTENKLSMVEKIKENIVREFEMTEFGLLSYYLDIKSLKAVMECLFAKISMLVKF